MRSAEQIPCPCCSGHLKVIGSRKRSCIDSLGDKIVLIIRRLGCVACHRIHHELPDMLVPYKRFLPPETVTNAFLHSESVRSTRRAASALWAKSTRWVSPSSVVR
ncbi:DUF6431 domain-containing protein [Desulforudis sp. DRI-14]|uniref:DUF6431 domain-containing protein n=1 Tax=Desulforudis sp. DRI-14 TaxID=3459793 RepID=UPI004041841C